MDIDIQHEKIFSTWTFLFFCFLKFSRGKNLCFSPWKIRKIPPWILTGAVASQSKSCLDKKDFLMFMYVC